MLCKLLYCLLILVPCWTKSIETFYGLLNPTKKGMHLVGWDKVPLRKRDGGLGIRTTREANNAILAKAGRKETASRG
jgi:hypothetical protein